MRAIVEFGCTRPHRHSTAFGYSSAKAFPFKCIPGLLHRFSSRRKLIGTIESAGHAAFLGSSSYTVAWT